MAIATDQQIATYENQKQTKPKYIYEFRVKTRRVKGEFKILYTLHIQDARFNKCFLVMSLRNWYLIIDYLSLDDRYTRGKDYVIVKDRRYAKAGKVDLIGIMFYNLECARRVIVFILSILGVENRSGWISKMIHVMRKLSPEAIDFWLNTAYDRFIVAKNGLLRRFRLLRVSKSYENSIRKKHRWGIP